VSTEFYGDEILLTFYETLSFSFLTMSAKIVIFNIMKPSIKLSLKLDWMGKWRWSFIGLTRIVAPSATSREKTSRWTQLRSQSFVPGSCKLQIVGEAIHSEFQRLQKTAMGKLKGEIVYETFAN